MNISKDISNNSVEDRHKKKYAQSSFQQNEGLHFPYSYFRFPFSFLKKCLSLLNKISPGASVIARTRIHDH